MAAKPKLAIQETQPDPFVEHVKEYQEHLAAARRSAEITATAKWQELFSDFKDRQEKKRIELAERLHSYSEMMGLARVDEEGEKAIKEVAKQSAELREEESAFYASVVKPIREPVRDCERTIDEIRATAARFRNQEPLLHREIIEEADALIDTLSHAVWDAKAGVVSIKPPKTDPDSDTDDE